MIEKYPYGMTEAEHNAFCDKLKCKYGNYCNFILGLCQQCKDDRKSIDEEFKEAKRK